MIRDYATDIAAQMGIQLSKASVVEGQGVGCLDVQLLHMTAKGHLVSALVYQPELNSLQSGLPCDQLETKIRIALSRLEMMLKT